MPRCELTIVIPCYNERDTILEIISRVKRLPIDKEILIVDNCSTDSTRELLIGACTLGDGAHGRAPARGFQPTMAGQEILSGDGFVVVLQPSNMTKGTSVKTGIALASGRWVICQDADLEYDPEDILKLLEHAERTGAVAVFGSRLAQHNGEVRRDAFHVGRVALTQFFNVLYQSRLTDVATCYKLMRTDVARELGLTSSGFDLDFEIPAKLRRKRYSIEDVPVSYHPRTQDQGKKIRWRDGLTAAWTMTKARFG